jgi:hypothetical protein
MEAHRPAVKRPLQATARAVCLPRRGGTRRNGKRVMKFTAQYPQMTVHRSDCRDLAKSRNQADTRVTREATDVAKFIAGEIAGDLEEMGYTANDFTVLPCTKTTDTHERRADEVRARQIERGLGPVVIDDDPRPVRRPVTPCPCECNSGGFCGGCGHAGCSGGINVR